MGRTIIASASLRETLGTHLALKRMRIEDGEPTERLTLDDTSRMCMGRGTPPIASGPLAFKHAFLVDMAYYHGPQTAAKQRKINVTAFGAFEQLRPAFVGRHEKPVTELAKDLLRMVEAKGLLGGYSAIHRASACILAAQCALRMNLLSKELLRKMGLQPPAMMAALEKLKAEMRHKNVRPEAELVVRKRRGDVRRFPGYVFVQHDVEGESLSELEVRHSSQKVYVGSPLRQVVCSSDLLSLSSRSHCLQKRIRYYASQPDEEAVFDLEDESPEDATSALSLPVCDAPFGTEGSDAGHHYVDELRRRQNTVHMGSAMGSLLSC